MPGPTDDAYLDPYRAAARRHGGSFEAMLWGSEAAQVLRFDVMIDLAGLEDAVIVDAGCGRGDLARRLIGRGVPFRRYHGVDALPEMIEAAAGRVRDPRVRFEVADVATDPGALSALDPDWVCFSGTLNTMDDATARSVVLSAWGAAARGVVFNFLSDRFHPRWTERPVEPARRFDTAAWVDWALEVTPCVAFRQDYLDGHDATIAMWHAAPG